MGGYTGDLVKNRARAAAIAALLAAGLAAGTAAPAYADEGAGDGDSAAKVEQVEKAAPASQDSGSAEAAAPAPAETAAAADAGAAEPAAEPQEPASDADGQQPADGASQDAAGQESDADAQDGASGDAAQAAGDSADGQGGVAGPSDTEPAQAAGAAAAALNPAPAAKSASLDLLANELVEIGEGQAYTSLSDYVNALQSALQVPGVGTVSPIAKIVSDITEGASIAITSGIDLTVIGDGAHGITFSSGGFVVDGGSLALGDGDTNDAITVSGNGTLVTVKNGGTFTLNDGATINGSVRVGNDSADAKSVYAGNGGAVNGQVRIDTNGDGYIKGGTYTNTGDAPIRLYGGSLDAISGTDSSPVEITNAAGHGVQLTHGAHIGTISGNVTITSETDNSYETGYAAIRLYDDDNADAEGASSIDRIEGGYFYGDNYGLTLSGSKSHVAYVGEIAGGTFYGDTNGLNVNHYASVGTISGGEFYGVKATNRNADDTETQWGGGAVWNFGIIDTISGGYFSGADGLGNYATINQITGGTFEGKDDYGDGIAVLEYADRYHADQDGNYPQYIGYIGSISNATMIGKQSGLHLLPSNDRYAHYESTSRYAAVTGYDNYDGIITVGSVSNCDITGETYGIMNDYASKITDGVSDCVITGGSVGILNGRDWYGETTIERLINSNLIRPSYIKGIANCKVIGGSYGIINEDGTIESITDTDIAITDEFSEDAGADTVGIYNAKATYIDSDTGEEVVYGSNIIDKITNVTSALDSQAWYGLVNEGFIDTITNSAFKGYYAGAVNEEGATLNTIVSGTYWGYGEAVEAAEDADTGDATPAVLVYGYQNKSTNATSVEPGLEASIGIGRYWGDTDAISGLDSKGLPTSWTDANGQTQAANIVFPEGYHMSARNYTLRPSSFVDAATMKFRYLKKPLTLSYDKNAAAATGTVASQTETKDGEELDVASSGYTRTGWKLTGWNTAADGTGTAYALASAIVLDDDTVLYAQWAPNKLTYDGNGGTGTMGSEDADEDGNVTVGDNGYNRDGYTFSGWNTKADGSGKQYTTEELLTLDGDVTLYAQWTPVTPVVPAAEKDDTKSKESEESSDTVSDTVVEAVPKTGDDGAMPMTVGAGLLALFAGLFARNRRKGEER